MQLKTVLLLACTLLASGCAIRGSGKNVAFAVDGAAIAGGAAMIASTAGDRCPADDPEVWGDHATCELGQAVGDASTVAVGLAVVAAGVVGLIANGIINAHGPESSPPAKAAPPAPALVTLPDSCAVRIAAWRVERDPATRTLAYRDMPAACQRQVERTAPAAD